MNQNNISQIIIIGGGYAGTLAAVRLAGKTRKSPVRITLVNGSNTFVERIRLHQLAANQTLPQRPFTDLLAKTGIHFVQGWVTAVSPTESTITINTQSGERQMSYDYLIYALGSTVATDTIPGIQENALTLGSAQTTHQLQQALPAIARRNGRFLVIGGGLTAIEAATEIAEAYPTLQVTLATKDSFGHNLSSCGAAHIRQVFEKLGIELVNETAVSHIEPHAAHTTDGQILGFDACLWAGAFAVPTLARDCGLPVDGNGRLLVTPSLQLQGQPNVYAIGDAAATPLRMACATAIPMGAYAADHLAARIQNVKLPDPFRFGYTIQCISLGRQQALVQFVDANDTPKEKVVTGWLGIKIKETICRATIWVLTLEKRLPGSYRWLQADIMPMQEQQDTKLMHIETKQIGVQP